MAIRPCAIGCWAINLAGAIPYGEVTVKFRYSHTHPFVYGEYKGESPEHELTLQVWRWLPGDASWTLASPDNAVDTVDHVIYASSDVSDGLQYFAVVQPVPLAGDVNGDGCVDVLDELDLIKAFGGYWGDAKYNPDCDFNGDEAVDVMDLLYMIPNFGKCLDEALFSQSLQSAAASGRSCQSDEPPVWYEVLEQAGLLDVYLNHIAEHPEAAP